MATALRRISSLTGTDSQPDSCSSPEGGGDATTCGATPWPTYRRRSDRGPAAPGVDRRRYALAGMDLSGPWRAAVADDDLRRSAVGLDFDDDGWEPIAGARATGARRRPFADSDGPLLYRTRFELDARRRRARATG